MIGTNKFKMLKNRGPTVLFFLSTNYKNMYILEKYDVLPIFK